MQKIKIFFLISGFWQSLCGYNLPQLGLGTSSFLDGGPLRQIPGWYWQLFAVIYHSNKFVDAHGKPLAGIIDPNLNIVDTAVQFIYLSQKKFLGGSLGFDIAMPATLYSHINKNNLNFVSSGSGLGDLITGVFIQWEPIMHGDRPIFIQRLEFVAIYPTGKNKLLRKTINPGSRIFYLNPYWAATIYFTPEFTASWRLNYAWCGTNHKTHIRAGDTLYFNYAVGYTFNQKFLLGINGYYLRQLKDSTLNDIPIPESREQVFAIGPGFLYVIEREYRAVAIANLYYEMAVRNRPKGIRVVLRYLKHF